MTPLRILAVVDDGDALLEPLILLLRGAGHEVRVAGPEMAGELVAGGGERFDAVVRPPAVGVAATAPLNDAEKEHIAATLRHTRGNKRQAAHLLGIARSTLLAKVRKYNL